jgi:hypothetical protein
MTIDSGAWHRVTLGDGLMIWFQQLRIAFWVVLSGFWVVNSLFWVAISSFWVAEINSSLAFWVVKFPFGVVR